MIVGLYQAEHPTSLENGLAQVETALAQAAEAGLGMLVLPEAFLPGYCAVPATPPDGWDMVLPRLADLCRRHGVALTLGLPEYEAGTVYNSAYSFAADGEVLARYRKIQLFGPQEQALYTPGANYRLFDYMGQRFGLLICYDVEFPEHVRQLARAGAQTVLVPTANMMPFVNVNQVLIPARAAENAVTIVYANYCGAVPQMRFVGLSGIFGPDGYSLGIKGQGPGLCFAQLPDPGWSEHGLPLATQLADFKPVPPASS